MTLLHRSWASPRLWWLPRERLRERPDRHPNPYNTALLIPRSEEPPICRAVDFPHHNHRTLDTYPLSPMICGAPLLGVTSPSPGSWTGDDDGGHTHGVHACHGHTHDAYHCDAHDDALEVARHGAATRTSPATPSHGSDFFSPCSCSSSSLSASHPRHPPTLAASVPGLKNPFQASPYGPPPNLPPLPSAGLSGLDSLPPDWKAGSGSLSKAAPSPGS